VLARGVARDGAVVVRRTDPAHGAFALDLLLVAPELQDRGFGADLLRAAEQFAVSLRGRVLLADVPSGAAGGRFRRFLVANGFHAAGDVPDYYPDGVSRLTFAKTLPVPAAAPVKPAVAAADAVRVGESRR
jgi:GNAT superfamily N-acetyltransferase